MRNSKRDKQAVSNKLSAFANRSRRAALSSCEAGFTLLELIIVMVLMAILTFGAIPIARNLIRREREKELHRTLRELRDAIDAYHVICNGQPGINFLDRKVGDACYPPKLEILVEGVHLNPVPPQPGVVSKLKPDQLKTFLRRIPKDPMTGTNDWGMRSVQDDPDSTSWGGQNVYDVFTKAQGVSLDGKSKYVEW